MELMRRLGVFVRLLDRFFNYVDEAQMRRKWLAIPVAVFRKAQDDQAGNHASLISYYGFLSLFPLLFVFSSLLGFIIQAHPALRAHVVSAVARSFPSLSSFITSRTRGNGAALGVGTVFALAAGLAVTQAAEAAMNDVWNIPLVKRPNFWQLRLRGLLLLTLLGTAFLLSAALASLEQVGGAAGVPAAVTGAVGSLAINFALYLGSFRVLTRKPLAFKTLAPGAVVGAVGWTLLQSLGVLLVRHQLAHASHLYGTLAAVVGLLGWIALGARLTIYAAELNVVLSEKLWPRSLRGAAKTEADERVHQLLIRQRA